MYKYLLFFTCLGSCQHHPTQAPLSEAAPQQTCTQGQYFSLDDQSVRYICALRMPVYPFLFECYPIIELRDRFGNTVKQPEFLLHQTDTVRWFYEHQIAQFIALEVDTTRTILFPLGDYDCTQSVCYYTKPFVLKNHSSESWLLLDRYSRLKLVLQAQNHKKVWKDLHAIRNPGCGMESMVGALSEFHALPPETQLHSCLFLENEPGSRATNCRLKLSYFNQIDSFYLPSSATGGIMKKRFRFDEMEKPVYSNTFILRISPKRFTMKAPFN